jgi:hypothetical protein
MTMPSSAASFGEMIKTFNDRLEKHLAAATGTPFAVSFVTATLPPIDAARCAELFTHFAAPARLW